jgi:hypothetical protein
LATDTETAAAISSHNSATTSVHGISNTADLATSSSVSSTVSSAISTHNTAANGHIGRGTTANRPASPATGDLFYDTTINNLIRYNGTSWIEISPVPNAPTSVSATTGLSGQATVSFTAPTNVAVSSYTVTSSPGNITASGASSPITVTGLTNGTAYTFTVRALNANGTSTASSASNSVTPTAAVTATALIVAGGGSAGGLGGGGGGGGVIPTQSVTFLGSTQYLITVGGPGGQIGPGDLSTNGVKGSNSSVVDKDGTYTAVGGGGGIAYASGSVPSSANGGSGGGGNNQSTLRGTGTAGQGNNGGFGGDSNITAAGGGGYSTSGSNGTAQAGGNGGQGYQLPSDIANLTAFSGMTYVGSGGGGGSRGSLSGAAGTGGTGAGNGAKGYVNGGNATSFGSGGGGGAQSDSSQPISASGAGKDGVVVIKTTGTASSYTGSLQTANGFNYYVFTTSGSITF